MNSVQLIGRLTADPKSGEYKKGKEKETWASFTLAVDRGYGEDKTADFIDCTVFRNSADALVEMVTKGMKIAITGELQQSKYEDKDGNNRSKLGVIVHKWEFCESKKDETEKKSYRGR